MPMLQHKEFWNKLFDGMYSLAVMMSISTSTTSKNIEKMILNSLHYLTENTISWCQDFFDYLYI